MIRVNYDEKSGKVIGFNKDTKPYIEITEAERKQPLPNKYSYYAVENGKFVIKQRPITDEEKAREAEAVKQKRLAEIDKWFNDNDWIINKVFLGEWETTDPRWIEYLKKRAEIRAEHEKLTNKIMAGTITHGQNNSVLNITSNNDISSANLLGLVSNTGCRADKTELVADVKTKIIVSSDANKISYDNTENQIDGIETVQLALDYLFDTAIDSIDVENILIDKGYQTEAQVNMLISTALNNISVAEKGSY